MANIMKRNKGYGATPATTSSYMPFGGLVEDIFQNTLNRFFGDDDWGFNDVLNNTEVPVNIRETDQAYEMEVVAPGLNKEQFDVRIHKNMLNVSFEDKKENKEENKQEGYLRQEYRRLAFSRSFMLDDTLDADKISAQYKDGVLTITLPKKEGAQRITKNIAVK
ncbi:Hsp20/alpha crystallin family protein [Longitalea arenae]|uniref:Hsp20/alpha crystallin family protein n=1 Tax=Longitalea arenae TaxID=2812558 RepID=UPI0019684E83|nr:Hsp20/alpha crystallin family protein [Longitalea arenae]